MSDLYTYRAPSLAAALQLVREQLGPEASVLHTREVRGGVAAWFGGRQVEVTASVAVQAPSRLQVAVASPTPAPATPAADHGDFRRQFRRDLYETESAGLPLDRGGWEFASPAAGSSSAERELRQELAIAGVPEARAQCWLARAAAGLSAVDAQDEHKLRRRLAEVVEDDLLVAGPIQLPPGTRRVVALVGPTGVGKTTTVAKLAATFRLRHKASVGLITVDTYRIAAVEQLRAYADIMDLPMEVVATPVEMRAAVARLADQDLVLIDTAGRSPADELKIQELRTLLHAAQPDEVHLVLSSVSAGSALLRAAERFAPAGVTALVLSKLDEAVELRQALPLVSQTQWPLSYVTCGQNVPQDLRPAHRGELARLLVGLAEPA